MGIIFITAAIIMLASLSGLVFLVKGFSGWLQKNSNLIIAFSSGIFAVVTYDLFTEASEMSGSWIYALVLVALGFLVFSIVEKFLPEIHHHEEDDKDCAHSKHKVIWGDALHNIGDGILLAASFAVDVRLGIIAAFGIFIHEFVQEITEFSVLRLSGMSVKKALLVNLLVASTIFVGVFAGLYVVQIDSIAAILFGLSAGVFLHLVTTDLLPKSIESSHKDKKYFTYLLLVVAGILTLVGVNKLGGHEALHDHDHDHEYEEEIMGEHYRNHPHDEDHDHDHEGMVDTEVLM